MAWRGPTWRVLMVVDAVFVIVGLAVLVVMLVYDLHSALSVIAFATYFALVLLMGILMNAHYRPMLSDTYRVLYEKYGNVDERVADALAGAGLEVEHTPRGKDEKYGFHSTYLVQSEGIHVGIVDNFAEGVYVYVGPVRDDNEKEIERMKDLLDGAIADI